MYTANLSSYPREQLSDILRILKLYKTSLVQIGHRARLMDPHENREVSVRIEYPIGISLSEIHDLIVLNLSQYFAIQAIPVETVYYASNSLIGGIRIFVDDDMLDVSFQKFANQFNVLAS